MSGWGEDACVIYARISDDHMGLQLGVQRQVAECRGLAERLGKTVVDVFIDNDVSAFSGKVRPEYRRMFKALESGTAPPCVLAWHNDRLNRNPRELLDWIDMGRPRKVTVQTVQAGVIDLSTPTGVALAITLAAWAQQESAHKGERVAAKRSQKAHDGLPNHGSRRPFGYASDGMTLVPDEALLLAGAYDSVLDGLSVNAVVAKWNRLGILTTAGSPWRIAGLKQTMRNPRYAGKAVYRGEVVADAQWPALVSRDIFDSAVVMLRRKPDGVKRTPKYLGSGLYLCPCGRRMVAAVNNGKRSYRCISRTLPGVGGDHVTRLGAELDEYVIEAACGRLEVPGNVRVVGAKSMDHVDVGALEREVRTKENKIAEYLDMFDNDEIDRPEYNRRRLRLKTRIDELQGQIAAALRGNAAAAFIALGANPAQRFREADAATQRSVVADLMEVRLLHAPRGAKFDGRYVEIVDAQGEEASDTGAATTVSAIAQGAHGPATSNGEGFAAVG